MDANFSFKFLEFGLDKDQVVINKIGDVAVPAKRGIVDLGLECADETNEFKTANLEENRYLKYKTHKLEDNYLEIVQETPNLEVKTVLTSFDDSTAIRIFTEVKNISGKDLELNTVSAFNMYGFGGRERQDEMYFTRFHNSRYAECQPVRNSFDQLGLFMVHAATDGDIKICHANLGTASCREEIPQGIIENATTGQFIMFQLESSNLWYYEIADNRSNFYLHLGGAHFGATGWKKALTTGATYRTIPVAIALGTSDEDVVGEMTKYRRHIARKNEADKDLPVIFNEYMHLAWDFPWEENSKKYAPTIAQLGAKYYVIDCGWHKQTEDDTYAPTAYVGEWKESLIRFPKGLKAFSQYLESLGMKLGLWISQEVVGEKCDWIIEKLGDDCFIQRNGKKIKNGVFYSLDYRNPKVREYMTEVVRRMVEDYGAKYIKYDGTTGYNFTSDKDCLTLTEGLELTGDAFTSWRKEMAERFPDVVFEGCCAGGLRLDYEWLQQSSLVSTSDQVDYLKYPYIIGNVLSAILPEQAGVWSYPAVVDPAKRIMPTKEWVKENLTDEEIIMNMINSFLGRIHLASDLTVLTNSQKALVKEGIDFYNSITEDKKKALPKFPIGFNHMNNDWVVAGIETDEKLYLGVWNLGGELHREIPLVGYKNAVCSYPKANTLKYSLNNDTLSVDFSEKYQARFFTLDK